MAALAVPFTAAPRAHAAATVVWETRVSDRILDFGVSAPNLDAPIKVNWDAWTAQMRNALPMLLNSVGG
ncbi:hypothetical protein [Nocardia wallacei]|uniref:hypothetical protein n=1 Tax=Nocardia wallacei TaxID=480035 RepID=UPI00245530DA|nr:hypothetical protein [Nocardia wallacei]